MGDQDGPEYAHGEELGIVPAQDVKEALESYDWIDRQFILKL